METCIFETFRSTWLPQKRLAGFGRNPYIRVLHYMLYVQKPSKTIKIYSVSTWIQRRSDIPHCLSCRFHHSQSFVQDALNLLFLGDTNRVVAVLGWVVFCLFKQESHETDILNTIGEQQEDAALQELQHQCLRKHRWMTPVHDRTASSSSGLTPLKREAMPSSELGLSVIH